MLQLWILWVWRPEIDVAQEFFVRKYQIKINQNKWNNHKAAVKCRLISRQDQSFSSLLFLLFISIYSFQIYDVCVGEPLSQKRWFCIEKAQPRNRLWYFINVRVTYFVHTTMKYNEIVRRVENESWPTNVITRYYDLCIP